MQRATRSAYAFMLALLIASCLAGCGDAGGYLEHEPTGSANDRFSVSAYESTGDAGVLDADGGLASRDGSLVSSDAGRDYSDEELIGILVAIDEAEIILGLAGQFRATDSRVQELGADVIDAHRQARARALGLGILPVPSDQAALYVQAGLTLQGLSAGAKGGEAFDSYYLNLQIMLDALVSAQIDRLWLPDAESAEVQGELIATRDALRAHMDRAVALRNELRPATQGRHTDAGASTAVDQNAESSEPAGGRLMERPKAVSS